MPWKEDPRPCSVPPSLERALSAGHVAFAVQFLRVLAEIPDVAVPILRVEVIGHLLRATVYEDLIVDHRDPDAEDRFKVRSRHAKASVPFVSTKRAVRTAERTPLEPKVLDNKFYVRGVGTVREVTVKGPTERLELISFKRG